MRDLPRDREKALVAIANGWGRTATAAHPDCICNRPMAKPKSPPLKTIGRACGPDPEPKILARWEAYWAAQREFTRRGGRWDRRDCPVHRS